MTIKEWKERFESYVNTLKISRDEYRGIMECINDSYSIMKKQRLVGKKSKVTVFEFVDYLDAQKGMEQ